MGLQEQLSQYTSTITAVTAVAIASYIIFKKLKKNKTPQQKSFRWSFSNELEMVGANKVKFGFGVQNIKRQDSKKFVYLCVEQHIYDIPKIILNWDLNNLNRLFLRDNKIQSIQQLNRIKMPNLQILVLSDNKITEIKSLRRLSTPCLIWIELQNNPICQKWDSLTQMNLNSLLYLWIQFFGNDKPTHDDIRWLAKSESVMLQKFHANGNKRLIDQNCLQILSKKYNKLDIRVHSN